MREIDENAVKAKNDSVYREHFISGYEPYILQTAYKVTGQYVSKSDDQWSVALFAFLEAIQAYSLEKGRFLPFAEMVIRRRLYDHIKKQSRHSCETPVNPLSFGDDPDEEEQEDINIRREILEKTANVDSGAKWEIEAVSGILSGYGFCFFDLISVSPKAAKTKSACARAIAFLSKDPDLLEKMRKKKTIPASVLEKNLGIPPKILERHRKYIITAVEIVSGDFPILGEYLRFVKEE